MTFNARSLSLIDRFTLVTPSRVRHDTSFDRSSVTGRSILSLMDLNRETADLSFFRQSASRNLLTKQPRRSESFQILNLSGKRRGSGEYSKFSSKMRSSLTHQHEYIEKIFRDSLAQKVLENSKMQKTCELAEKQQQADT